MAKLNVKTFSDLEQAKTRYENEIDAEAEAIRRRYITAAPGQTMSYEAKHREAQRYPNGSKFPFLEAEAEALGLSLEAVAESILTARTQWETIGSGIEAARLKAKQQVRGAGTAAEMHAIAGQAFQGLGT